MHPLGGENLEGGYGRLTRGRVEHLVQYIVVDVVPAECRQRIVSIEEDTKMWKKEKECQRGKCNWEKDYD